MSFSSERTRETIRVSAAPNFLISSTNLVLLRDSLSLFPDTNVMITAQLFSRPSYVCMRAFIACDKYIRQRDTRDVKRANEPTFTRFQHRLLSDRLRRQLEPRMRVASVTQRHVTSINIQHGVIV